MPRLEIASPEVPTHPRPSSRWRVVRLVALVAGLGFLGWMLWSTLRNPAFSFRAVSGAGLVASFAVGLAANALVSVMFADLVGKLVPTVPFERRLASYYLSQLAKYVPGRIAALLVQSATLAAPRSMTVTLVTTVELMAITIWTCTIAAAICALWSAYPLAAGAVAVVGTVVAAWLMRIDWKPALRVAWRLARRTFDDRALEVCERPSYARALVLAAGAIALPAASMFTLVAWGFRLDGHQALVITSALLLSWVGGTIAVLFPAGIGIREMLFLALGHIAGTSISLDHLAAIALL
jgi:hypothetical protein